MRVNTLVDPDSEFDEVEEKRAESNEGAFEMASRDNRIKSRLGGEGCDVDLREVPWALAGDPC